jgi:hypothetical protein
MEIKTLEESPRLEEFCEEIRKYENKSSRHNVKAYDLKLYPDDELEVKGKTFDGKYFISDEAGNDLAHLTEIPAPYFAKCTPELKAFNFNHRLRTEVAEGKPLQIVLKNEMIVRVLNSNLLPAPRLPILDTVSNSIPENIVKEDLGVIVHCWDEGQFDISIIASNLNCEIHKGDIVAFGIHISETRDGSMQVQGAAFRLWCSNGAINRICNGNQHRLRRPINRSDKQQQFLQRIKDFAQEAWRQWEDNAEGLMKMRDASLDSDQRNALISRLRQAPFFLSMKAINRVLERLVVEIDEHQAEPSMYDLWNALTFIGTHNTDLSLTNRFRLRLASGEFTRNESRFCNSCRQLLLS